MKSTAIIIVFLWLMSHFLIAQLPDSKQVINDFVKLYTSGKLVEAEKRLRNLLETDKDLSESYQIAVYNNLGAISTLYGNYNNALTYYNQAEEIELNKGFSDKTLGDIYINKAIIFKKQKMYNQAFEYFEKGIEIFKKADPDPKVINSLSLAYLNIGICHIEINDIKSALLFLTRSAEIRIRHKLPDLSFVYLNLAKAYDKANQKDKAEEHFNKSIDTFINEFGPDYYRLAEAYFDYGVFLKNRGKLDLSYGILSKSLTICLNNYGLHHTLTSLSYKLIGDNYLARSLPDSALVYYQKSLIAVVPGFESEDINDNPAVDSSLFDIRLLDNLKSKARALAMIARQQPDIPGKKTLLDKGIETIGLSLDIIDRIRKSYPDEESRLYLADNEKTTYDFALSLFSELYSLSPEEKTLQEMYYTAVRAKSAVLRDELAGAELQRAAGIPDSLTSQIRSLTGMAAAYNNLVLEETRKSKPDSGKIRYWKDEIFTMNREKEKIISAINREYPVYSRLLQKTEPLPLSAIQKKLGKDDTVLDYYLASPDTAGNSTLCIFVLTHRKLDMITSHAGPDFRKNISTVTDAFARFKENQTPLPGFNEVTEALFKLYGTLFLPARDKITGDKVRIIPDGDIANVPFDALIGSLPPRDQVSYEGLDYLINRYIFSFDYSSSLIAGRSRGRPGIKVYAFAPDYSSFDASEGNPGALARAEAEIKSVLQKFKGVKYSGSDATETGFLRAGSEPVILHLAMHLASDTSDSKYSYLLFDRSRDSLSDGRLYNYEISLARIRSPLVVLSACNSGSGTLTGSEGPLSVARSFILAGAGSVIRTSWKINDETGAEIMSAFYGYLSEGKAKDEALRLAKLSYLEGHPPVYTNPYYWAAFEVLGDNSPVIPDKKNRMLFAVLTIFTLLLILTIYFRRRNIFSAFSR